MARVAPDPDVLVAGEYFCDLVFEGLEGAPRLGREYYASDLTIMPGGTYTMALALTRLGVVTRWVATLGTDIFSRFVRERAEEDGIDTTAFEIAVGPVQRVSIAFSAVGERGFISYSAPPVVPPHPALAELQRPRWLLQTLRFEPDWLAFISQMKARGVRVFADCRDGDFSLATPGVREFLALADVFSPNGAEAMRLAGTTDLEEAIATLGPLVPTLTIKCGPQGARLVTRDDAWQQAAPEVRVLDTIGAGDAFNAGYLYGLINQVPARAALQLGVLCGSLSTMATGGRACPTLEALARFAVQCGMGLESEVENLLTLRSDEFARRM